MSSNLTNARGLASTLRLPVAWVIDEADAGRLPHLRVGRKRLFNVEAVRAVLAERAARMPHAVESGSERREGGANDD